MDYVYFGCICKQTNHFAFWKDGPNRVDIFSEFQSELFTLIIGKCLLNILLAYINFRTNILRLEKLPH